MMVTAGKQLYETFIFERKKRLLTAAAVWICMLLLSGVCMMQKNMVGIFFLGFGILLAAINVLSCLKMKNLLHEVEDKDQFQKELESDSAYTDQERKILILDHYVLLKSPEVVVLPMKEMKMVEVGCQENVKKTLFLTGKDDKRHPIISCIRGDGKQEEFDQIYHVLLEKIQSQGG